MLIFDISEAVPRKRPAEVDAREGEDRVVCRWQADQSWTGPRLNLLFDVACKPTFDAKNANQTLQHEIFSIAIWDRRRPFDLE